MINFVYLCFIAFGGAMGAILRYIMVLVLRSIGTEFPYGTLFVNVVGSLLMGIFFVYFSSRSGAHEPQSLMLTVGFLGAFTTYSAFSLDTVNFLINAQYDKAMLNILLNTILSIGFAYVGIRLGRTFVG